VWKEWYVITMIERIVQGKSESKRTRAWSDGDGDTLSLYDCDDGCGAIDEDDDFQQEVRAKKTVRWHMDQKEAIRR
jgi:hypothetical protein